MGAKLCRLETIRRGVAPWQQLAIDQIATTARLMAHNAQNAILFVNANRKELWLGDVSERPGQPGQRSEEPGASVGNAVEFASVSKEYRDLEHKLGD